MCVMVNGMPKKFVNAFVTDVSNPACFSFEYCFRENSYIIAIESDTALYGDFTRKWRFGWVPPKTREELFVHGFLEGLIDPDYTWFELLDGI